MMQDDQAFFRTLFEHASSGMVVVDAEGRFVHCNLAFCAMVGYSRDELAGRSVEMVSALEEAPRLAPERARLTSETFVRSEWRLRRKDGSGLISEALSGKLPNGLLLATVTDITERARADEVRRAREKRDRYFLALERRLRDATSSREAVGAACEAIGRELGAAFAGMGELQPDSQTTTVESAWSAAGDLTPFLGRHSHLSAQRLAELLGSGATSVEDTLADPRIAEDAGTQAAFRALGMRSAICAPLMRDDAPRACLIVGETAPRKWTEEEVALASETLDRVWHAAEQARAEEELRLATERFEVALKDSPITVLCQDLDLRHTWVYNSCFATSALMGRTERDVFERAEDAAAAQAVKREAMRTGKSQRAEITVRVAGADRIYDLLAVPLLDSCGKIAGVTCAMIDITARKKADAALRDSEERFRFCLRGAGAAAWQHDFLTEEQVWSPESYALHGLDPKLGAPRYEDWLQCLHPDDRARVEQVVSVAIEKKTEYRTQYRVALPSGEMRWLDALGKIEYAPNGSPLRIAGINLDVTERKRAEEKQRQSDELLRLSLRGSRAVPGRWDIQTGEMIGWAESYRLFGREPEPATPYTYDDWVECLHPDDRAKTVKEVFDAMEKGAAEYRAEYRIVLPSGEVRWLDVLGHLDYAAGGSPLRMHAIILDITERKSAEEALRESDELLRLSMKSAGAAAWRWDIQRDEMTGSRENYELFGLDPTVREPLRFADWLQCLHPEDRANIAGKFLEGLKKPALEYRDEYRIVRPSGEVRWLAAAAKVDFAADGSPLRLSGINLDITERKRVEEALRESEERLRFCLKSAQAGAWQIDIPAKRIIWSPECCEVHGRDPKLGSPLYGELIQYLHPDDRERVEQENLDALIGRVPEFRLEYRVVLTTGEIRWLAALGMVDYAADGSPLLLSGIAIDITERKRAEEALRKAEEEQRLKREELETVLAAIPAPVLIATDASCEDMTGNPAAYDLLHRPAGTNLSKSAPAGKAPRDFEIYRNGKPLPSADLPIRKATATKRAISGEEIELRFVDGRSKFLLGNVLPLLDGAGEVRGAVAAYADITELKRTETALRESEEHLRLALDAAGAGTWSTIPETGEFRSSDRALALHGAAPGTPMTLQKALETVHPEDRPRVTDLFDRMVNAPEPFRVEVRMPLPDGSIRWVESRGEPRLISGRLVVNGLLQDITDRKRAETALRESEELLRAIIEHFPVPILLSREDRKILLVNPALTKLTGYTHSDIPTRDEWEAYAYREHAARIEKEVAEIFQREAPTDRGAIWVHTKTGDKRLWVIRTAPAGRDGAGKRLAVTVALDITDRHKSAKEARGNRARLEAALASMADAVVISDTEGRYTHYNTAFASFHRLETKGERLCALEDRNAAGDLFLPSGEYVPPRDWPCPKALRGETAANVEYLIRRPGGETYCSSNFAPIRDGNGEIIGAVVTARDITEQKRAEKRLRESEAQLRSIIDTAADAIVVVDEKGVIQSANRSTASIFGYSPEELIGRHASILVAPRVQGGIDKFLAGFYGNGSGIWEMEAQRKNGETVPLNVAIAEWKDSEGRRFFVGILRDLSESKRQEEALANARRLEAVGQLAGGVAHDFNNLLSVIAGNLELAADRIGDEAAGRLVSRALDAAEKGAALNRRLLSLASRRSLQPQSLNLNDRVEETAKLLTSIVGEHIAVVTDLAAGLWMAQADPGEVDSAMLNIAANARDAMPGGGRIEISTANVTLDEGSAGKLHSDARPGDYVCLTIADDGPGMTEDILGKAMEPFFTTKGPGAGTGLGLTSVASFARHSGGFSTISSAPGLGCTVRTYLPRCVQESAGDAGIPDGLPLGDGELVLVAEDDDRVREMTLKRIEALGYAVAEARSGAEAIALLKSGAPVQLVLSDVVMPGGMTGYEVARWVASNRPDIKVIICSGYNEGDRTGANKPAQSLVTLGKPYSREQLARALRDALASS
ncbi:MAG: PAS domain S-box protein [Rhodomicrobium sp.]